MDPRTVNSGSTSFAPWIPGTTFEQDISVCFEALNFRMSNLANVLKEFEKDQLEEEKDHENDDDVTGAVLTENDKSHYQSVEKSNLRPVVVGQKYTGSISTT